VTRQLAGLDESLLEGVLTAPQGFPSLQEADELLIEGLREGRESAYETLIEGYQRPIFNLVSRLLRDPDEACDVVQEVFLKVFRKVGAFRGDSSLKTWIYRVAVNEAHNYRRWNGRHRGQEVGLEGGQDSRSYAEVLPAAGDSPYEYVLDREKHRLIEAALSRLNPGFRSVIVLRDIEDLSYEEIAEILRIPMGTVKSRILRGREALRRELERHLEPEPDMQWWPQMAE